MAKKLDKIRILEPINPVKSTALFSGKSSGILNWNDLAYPHLYDIYRELVDNFWIPQSINMGPDSKQFSKLSEEEREAYLLIIGLLSSLDAPQTRMALLLSQYASEPAAHSIMAVVAQQEAVHNESYSYILSSIVSEKEQQKSFDVGRVESIVMERNDVIMEGYDDFIKEPTLENAFKTLVNSTILEGLFFYSGFAFFYNLARQQKMVGTSTMISYINRDELAHGRTVADFVRIAMTENPEMNTPELTQWIYNQYDMAVEHEIKWSKYALGKIDGIDLEEMEGFLRYRANKMLRLLGLSDLYEGYDENPMEWIAAFIDNFDGVKTDFFEQHSRQYVKVSELQGFDDL